LVFGVNETRMMEEGGKKKRERERGREGGRERAG
jgi:hypothetical protein